MDQVRKITQAYSQTPWRKQMQTVGMFLVILVLGLIIAIVYVNVSAEAATTGRKIQEMQAEIEDLERSIENKQSHLAYITSAVEMEKRAEDMGFKPVAPGQAVFIEIEGYGGRTEASLAPHSEMTAVQKVALSPEYTLSLTDWLRQQLYLPVEP